jgi:PAS domain S-box-containing protein
VVVTAPVRWLPAADPILCPAAFERPVVRATGLADGRSGGAVWGSSGGRGPATEDAVARVEGTGGSTHRVGASGGGAGPSTGQVGAAGAHKAPPDAVVAVCELREEADAERITRLREAAPGRPVLACSAAPDGELAIAATRAGAEEYCARDHLHAAGETITDRVGALAREVGDDQQPGTAPLDRPERSRRIEQLHESTRRMMDADSPAEVARVAVLAANDILHFDSTSCRLYDPETATLRIAARRGTAAARDEEPPVYGADEGVIGAAFQRGETQCLDLDADLDHDYGAVEVGMTVPLGEYGVLSMGATDRSRFDATARRFGEVLAANAEQALARAARRSDLRTFEQVFESVRDMVFVLDASGRVERANGALHDRVCRDDLRGATLEALVDDAAGQPVAAHVDAVVSGATDSRSFEATIRCDAAPHNCEQGSFPARVELSRLETERGTGRVTGVVRDISELDATRESLSVERDRFRQLFDRLPGAAVHGEHYDDGVRVTEVNEAFEETFGWDAGTAVGRDLDDLIVPERAAVEGDELRRALERKGHVEQVVERRTADGLRTFVFHGVRYDDAGARGDRAFGIYVDITDERRGERQREVLLRVLRHNLRNDLNVVLAFADSLAESIEDPELAARAERLNDVADDLLSLSESATEIQRTIRDSDPVTSRVDAAAVARASVDAAREDSVSAAAFDIQAPDHAPVRANERVRKAVDELVENAADHGGDRVALEVGREGDGWVAIRVVDDGPGVPSSERAVLTGERDITQLEHGSGLGLWLVRWIVDGVGGRLRFEDRPNGHAVTLLLPAADGTAESTTATSAPRSSSFSS